MLISILPANSFPSCRLRSEQQLRFRRRTACFFPAEGSGSGSPWDRHHRIFPSDTGHFQHQSGIIPFTSGSGTYQISCYEQVNGSQYAALFAQALEVSLENEFLPFLYPNQYVNFTPDSEACKLALSLLAEDATEQESIDTIFQYVTQHVTYDEDKAANVETGYLPDIDKTLSTGKGICFDYAALMTAMLRSRDIPCKLQIGYAGDIKHAWIDVYIRGKGWVEQAITYDGEKWNRMDPTFTANSEDEELINSYIGDSANYTLQFTR